LLLQIQNDYEFWTSNTVIVVDTSGSMKESDVWGTRHRLAAVWVAVALDFLAHGLETGSFCSTDVISIVQLCESPTTVLREWPCTWVTYNKLVEIYRQNQIPPYGHGPFLPALVIAEDLLMRNKNAACAASLVFLSDGRPSDVSRGSSYDDVTSVIVSKTGEIARQFGRRLTFTAIGIGDYGQFRVLEDMVEAAKDYGAIATFKLPSMTSEALGQVFTTVSSSVTTTKTELTDVHTLLQRRVRNVLRESRSKAREDLTEVSEADFWVYPQHKIQRLVYREWYEGQRRQRTYDKVSLQSPEAKFVAFGHGPFGEGAERFAYRFYELAADRKTIVGKPLVAKESRLILDEEEREGGDEVARKKFVKMFCETQQLALRLARKFNQKLQTTLRVDPATPTIVFKDCSIYQLDDVNLGKLSVLVEERLDETRWKKWNMNNGYVEGMSIAPEFGPTLLRKAFTTLDLEDLIEEEEEEEEEEELGESGGEECVRPRTLQPIVFTPFQVAQAFSHFTYWASGRKRLVCDLQGVYDESNRILQLSDPVIHYWNHMNSDRRFVHGRTDRGKKGFAMFFETHECSHLCRLMLRGFRRPYGNQTCPPATKS
jgi:hypothetical protein